MRIRGISHFIGILGIALASVVIAPTPTHAQAVNLISNPGFETGTTLPNGWTKTYWGSPTPTFTYPVAGNGSSKAAQISFSSNSTGDARWAHTPVTIEPGATYTFSHWYKSTAATEINIEFTSSTGAKSYHWMASLPSSGNVWKQYTASFLAPSNARQAVVFHLIDRTGSLAVDDFSLVKGTVTPPPPQNAPTVSLSATPTSISSGQSSTLTWSSTNATSCAASGAWTGSKAISGTQAVSPSATATYVLTCSGAAGTTPAAQGVSVTVSTTPPPPTSGAFSEGLVSITFDDSWTSQYTNVLPILQAAGLKGTFYLTTEPIQGGWTDFMTPNQVKDIATKGHEIAGHTVTHADLTTLSQAAVNREIRNSKSYLQTLTGKTVTAFAYPYGAANATVKTLLKNAGYTSARGVDYETQNTATTDKYDLKSQCIETSDSTASIKAQIDAAKANKEWYVLCIHEVKDGGDQYTMTPARFQEIVNYIKQSGVKVVTVGQGRALMQ